LRSKAVGGASASRLASLPHAPSTARRAIPLPRFAALRGGGNYALARGRADCDIADMSEETIQTLSGAALAGLTCACPRCGRGKLFQGFLTLRPRCDVCGLDFGFADAGDGPAIFIMFFAGFIVVGAALVTEIVYQPPYWVHAALWLPLILVVTLGPLRPMKGLLIALQFHHKAAEGRLTGREP
jgi:uncharacterized protein (DUF983 family)